MRFSKVFIVYTISVFSLFGICSCANQTDSIVPNNKEEPKYVLVEEELVPYFINFEEEGLSRGIVDDLSNEEIKGVIREIHQDRVLGQCSYSQLNPGTVTIDKTTWQQASDRLKEFVVFHELGHCYLKRDHKEAAFSNGLCVSIMRSGTGNCWDNYNSGTRSYYLDELFTNDLGSLSVSF